MSGFWESVDDGPGLGPVFIATYETDAACCSNMIEPGGRVRADGQGGWVHANGRCDSTRELTPQRPCPDCFCVHAGECW